MPGQVNSTSRAAPEAFKNIRMIEREIMQYQPADTQWFSGCRFGIAAHWTAQSTPVSGKPLDFAAAVAAFDVEAFVDRVSNTGAEYLMFTGTHALQKLPAPCDAIDAILPGRTTERDLIGELMHACLQRGLYFLLYYNHSCNIGDDPQWEHAVGYHGEDKNVFADNLCRIVTEMGERYGQQLSAWWFDSSYSIDPSGPANMVTTDMSNFQFPWERFSASAKAGNCDRLVTFNAGMNDNERNHLYTSHQDYLAGEVNNLIDMPHARFGVHGLQEHRWVCLDNPNWIHNALDTPLAAPLYSEREITTYLQETARHGVPVTFNLDIDQTGAMNESSLDFLRSVAPCAIKERQSSVATSVLARHLKKITMPTTQTQPRIINIYNFIRDIEPRAPEDASEDLYQATVNQIDLIKQYNLPATYALQYDSLINERYQRLLLDRLDENDEIGAWWEIVQAHAEAAGLQWRGRFPWDWHANVGFSTGYTPAEREKLVDVYMHRFHEIFGYYPRTVGSWFIDSHSLAYMAEKYEVIASCNCKDQIGTDGYTLHGGYWNQAYYPSRRNAYMPAQSEAGQIPIPIFRMLGSDPVDQYDYQLGEDLQAVKTLEPTSDGESPDWVRWFFDVNINQPCLAFAYMQAGQENSMRWPAMKDGLNFQIPLIAQIAQAGQVRVETLEQSGRWFREQFKVTPPTAVVALNDSGNSGRKSIWYNSRFYRVNFIFEGGGLRIRDLHLFDEKYASVYLTEPLREKNAIYTTLPVLDGNTWSTASEVAGIRVVHIENKGYSAARVTLTEVLEISEAELLLRCELENGTTLDLRCSEDQIELNANDNQVALLMTWSPEKATTIEDVTQNRIAYRKGYFSYQIRTAKGHFEAIGAAMQNSGILFAPDTNGSLVLRCDTAGTRLCVTC